MFKDVPCKDNILYKRKLFTKARQTIEIGVKPYTYGYMVVVGYFVRPNTKSDIFIVNIDCKRDYNKVSLAYGCCLHLMEISLTDILNDQSTAIKDAVLHLPRPDIAEGSLYNKLLLKGSNVKEEIDIEDLIEFRRIALERYGGRY